MWEEIITGLLVLQQIAIQDVELVQILLEGAGTVPIFLSSCQPDEIICIS